MIGPLQLTRLIAIAKRMDKWPVSNRNVVAKWLLVMADVIDIVNENAGQNSLKYVAKLLRANPDKDVLAAKIQAIFIEAGKRMK
jgi:hypothetical protein